MSAKQISSSVASNTPFQIKFNTFGSQDDTAVKCRIGPSIWKPNQTVPIYYVSKLNHKGHFNTLNDAIFFAKPYCRIEVLSGRYYENIIVHKPMEIGSVNGHTVEFYSNSYTLVVTAEEAFIEGITISSCNEKSACLIKAGTCTLQRCVVGSLEVTGDANPNVNNNSIVDGKVHGVHVCGRAGGSYNNNIIERHMWYSVCVESYGSPIFMYNEIKSGEQGQVMIRGHPVKLDANIIHRGPNLNNANTRQRVSSFFSRQSGAFSETSKLTSTSAPFPFAGVIPNSNIMCSNDGTSHGSTVNPYFQYNLISDIRCVTAGTGECHRGADSPNRKPSVYQRGQRKVTQSSLTGIRKEMAAFKQLFKLPLKHSGDSVCLMPVDINNVHYNAGQLQSDNVTNVCDDHGRSPFDSRAAVEVSFRAAPTFMDNTIVGAVSNGIMVRQGGMGTFVNNYMSNNIGWGLVIEDAESFPRLIDNIFNSNGLGGLRVNKACVKAERNKFIDNRGCQALVINSKDFVFTNNEVRHGDRMGVICQDGGSVTIAENLFIGNSNVALIAEKGAKPVISKNLFVLSSGVPW